jgi:dGTP triphosphohydrolase
MLIASLLMVFVATQAVAYRTIINQVYVRFDENGTFDGNLQAIRVLHNNPLYMERIDTYCRRVFSSLDTNRKLRLLMSLPNNSTLKYDLRFSMIEANRVGPF